ncbi:MULTISPECIES: WecB/TagA/CpsF family glycosyltransferase [unclassified Arsukibacterium]|mgnify:CR=1 FL=1|uniref:WecB/TagA/CpsF family glycosyltransferase n=1 Tax=unclassified Arsukibacterium TaxID=2635278 RepID=UPI000C9376F1|nr:MULTISPECIES: WecB/TagA/CpsF family glycosyltransferase [unclassified Arsukibacterium]MAA93228.1 lipopolysaccharide N-acetylmannosaminouronosyltransferase [Rheinheimera sp.]HAW92703.1 lipopolysaccharide N-acetylmannosaminouronosyltransferase [Candidatus Azambacteria bacterium]|tara:strand:- start:711 stop:1451 length:741 start_codon:yes stop_codon:yes gene_type:complete
MSEAKQAARPEQVTVGLIQVAAFKNMASLLEYIVPIDKPVFAGSAIAINPEKVLSVEKDPQLLEVIQAADIRYADGIGVVKAMRRRLGRHVERIPGCELWQQLMLRAAHYKVPVFIIGAKPQVLAQTRDKLLAGGTYLVGAVDGYFTDETALLAQIKQTEPQIISVAMGSPRQELLIQRLRQAHPNCFYMGVGGTYDVYTGNVKRAPALWCKLNLEWAYRLALQPSRIGRQLGLLRYLWWYWTGKV